MVSMLALLSLLAFCCISTATSGDDYPISSFDGSFQFFIQFDKADSNQGYHLASALPGEADQGLVIGLNGPENPGNLAQQFLFEDSQLITSFGAVQYGSRNTSPSNTGYPLRTPLGPSLISLRAYGTGRSSSKQECMLTLKFPMPQVRLTKIEESRYLQFRPYGKGKTEKNLSMVKNTKFPGTYELANADGSRLNVTFGELYLAGRYSAVIGGEGRNAKFTGGRMKLLTYGPPSDS